MGKYRVFVTLLVAAGAWALLAAGVPWERSPDYFTWVAFLAALVLVSIFDVWLPRGDYTEIGAPLVVALLVLVPAPWPAIAALGARLVVWASRRFAEDAWRVAEDLARRALLVGACSALYARLLESGIGYGTSIGRLLPVTAVALAYLLIDFGLAQMGSALRLAVPLLPLVVGNARLRGWMATAQVSAAILAVLSFDSMGAFSVAVTVGLLLVTRQSFSLLIDIRAAYRSTVEALARAIEAHDPSRRGHAERVASLSIEAARLLGYHGRRLEALTYAALFHDVGRLDADDTATSLRSADVLGNVTFLASSVPILEIVDDEHGLVPSPDEDDLVAAYVVARMCELDDSRSGVAAQSTRSTADQIGARLYATTRRGADRAISRIEARTRARGQLVNSRDSEEVW